jgi:hypothetical protein
LPLLSHFGRSLQRPGGEAVSHSETLAQPKHNPRAFRDSNCDRVANTVTHAKRDGITYSHHRPQPISHGDRREFTLPFAD